MLKKALSSLFLAGGAALALVGMAVPNDDAYLSETDFTLGIENCSVDSVFTDMAKCVKILDYIRFEKDGSGSLTRIQGGDRDLWDSVVSSNSGFESYGDAKGYWGSHIPYFLDLGFDSSDSFDDGDFTGVYATVRFRDPPEVEAMLAKLGLTKEDSVDFAETSDGYMFELSNLKMGYPNELREVHVRMPTRITSTSGTVIDPITAKWNLDDSSGSFFAYSDSVPVNTSNPSPTSDSGSSFDDGSGDSPSISSDDGWLSEELCWWLVGGGTLAGFFIYLCDNERKVKGYERDPRKRPYWTEMRFHF